MNNRFLTESLGIYDSCWFEIKLDSKRIITRDADVFIKKSEALSRIHEVYLYKIEKTTSGMKRTRIHAI